MKNLVSILFLLFASNLLQAQNTLVFTHTAKNKLLVVKEGQTLSLRYTGYLGQTEVIKNVVTEISDSTITLGINPEILGGTLKNNHKLASGYKIVRISDIQSFRRMTIGRQLTKTLLITGVVVGSYFLLYNVYRNNNVSVGEGFLISLGIGIGSKLIIDACFPESPKYNMNDGWKATVLHP